MTSDQNPTTELSQREKEWIEVEHLVMLYKAQFLEDRNTSNDVESKAAAEELLKRFSPLFRKYLLLLKNGQIDFNDPEMKLFVCSFIEDQRLQRALRRNNQAAEFRADIYKKFNFIKETYGNLEEEDIMMDLQTVFLTIAKRYKQIGKSFCGYLYNSYRHEMSRHIKKFINNPLNIHYKNIQYEDTVDNNHNDLIVENTYEDTYYEDSTGVPDLTWISGKNCSELFTCLNPIERKILVKYYLEEWNDRQISEAFGIHINTVNQKRRYAVAQIAKELGIDMKEVKRNRRSGKNAILPIE